MANATLLDSLRSLVTPDLVSRFSSQLGESEAVTAKAVDTALPALLAGLATRADDTSLMQRLFELFSSPALDSRTLSNPTSVIEATQPGSTSSLSQLGSQFLSLLFGGQTRRISDGIAGASGARPTTASAVLGLAAPLVLGLLAKRTRDDGLDPSRLASLLLGQKSALLAALPAGVAALLGGDVRRPAAASARPVREASAGARRWIWPVALLIGVLALWSLLRDREPTRTAMRAPEPGVAAAPPAAEQLRRTLPGGSQITVPRGSLEDSLVAWIEDTSRPLDDRAWIDFDRLLFDTGSATLQPSSREQLRNVAAILVAYPSLKIKIGGYTDDVGDDAANLALSQARAESVRSELIALGVASDRLEAEGYGEQHPAVSNATEEGRAKNRRIALRILAR